MFDVRWISCCQCKCQFTLPEALYDAAKHSESIWFYCPYGHKQHFLQGESEENKLRRERDRLRQRLAEKQDEIETERKRTNAYKGQATRLRNRAKNGVCPCCNRSFSNLREHIKSQHPDFAKESV